MELETTAFGSVTQRGVRRRFGRMVKHISLTSCLRGMDPTKDGAGKSTWDKGRDTITCSRTHSHRRNGPPRWICKFNHELSSSLLTHILGWASTLGMAQFVDSLFGLPPSSFFLFHFFFFF